MVIQPKFLPQLFAYDDDEAKRILRNLKKVEIKNEYKLTDLGVREFVSIPKLDQKAFRYIEKRGQLFLRESVYSVGGLVQDTVLINLGDFTIGDDETGAELEYLVRVKDAKAKQRARQLQECERIAHAMVQKIHKQLKNDEILKKWQEDLQADKRFVRLGKEDYYQSQVAIIAKYAKDDENLAKMMVEYDQKINAKNEKWLTQSLKLAKNQNTQGRIGTELYEGIGELNPERRAEFEQYYAARSPQMTQYLTSEEEVAQELPAAPTIIADKKAKIISEATMTEQIEAKKKERSKSSGLKQIKQAFHTQQKAPEQVKPTLQVKDNLATIKTKTTEAEPEMSL